MTNNYYKAVIAFLAEYIEIPNSMYISAEDGSQILAEWGVDLIISTMIAKGIFSEQEIKETFFKDYGLILHYSTKNWC